MYKKLKIFIPVGLFIIFGTVQYFGLFSAFNNFIHDNIMTSSRPAADNIIIVGIDERSINEIGTWPWPRFFMAEAVARLAETEAAAIGVTVRYETPGAHPEYDEALVLAAQAAGDRLVLGGVGNLSLFRQGDLLEIDYYALPFDELYRVANVGFLNVLADENDGVMRRSLTSMRFGDITVHSFPFEVYRAYRRATGQDADTGNIPLDNNGQFPVRYVGGPGSFTTVSLWGVINEYYDSAMFRDAVVLIGVTATGIGDDNFITPAERRFTTYGVELYANVIQNFMEGIFVTDAPGWLNLAILAFVAVIVVLMFHWLRPLSAFFITVGLTIFLLAGAYLSYNHLYIITDVSDTIVFLFCCYLANLTLGILSAQSERQHIRGLFGRFVAPEVVNEIISGSVEVSLGGVVKEITALFVDIRGFTAFSESYSPEQVVDVVNRYLGLTSAAIQQNKGTIDKFIGDATMALFNAPNNVPDHALHAVKAAWAMKLSSEKLRKEIFEEYGIDLQFGIGINTGNAVVGNMGSDFRMDYTAIGDAINTAARIESNAGAGQIIISDATYQQVKDRVEATDLGVITVKNKKTGIQIYSVDFVTEQLL
ncbi:MAG: adenylate/guanylate cyclase domain-containing protein [Defluviitaleaceae bacterium]|nr:adenylate/guanylate cyclase domain-containing protein [Defluviitaleaceae bacterium]